MIDLHSIKTKAVVIKILYLLSFAGFASWLTYFNVYLKEVPQLSGFEIGVIAGIQQINTVFIVPIWGIFADKYGRKRVFSIALILSFMSLMIFMINTQFIYYVLFTILITAVYNPLMVLMDSIGLDFEAESKTVSFGEMRLWGSIGWASSAYITGVVINTIGIEYIFPISSALLLIVALITIFLYKPLTIQSGVGSVGFKDIFSLLHESPALLQFFLLILLYSLFAAPTYLFINLYYDEIGATSTHIGIANAVQSMSEIPFFFFGRRIVKHFGAKETFVFVMLVTVARMGLYGINDNPWVAIAIGASQGITMGLFIVAIAEYVHSIVPPRVRSTGQSLFFTFYSAGVCIGNILAGYLKDVISLQTTMLVNAAAILLLVFVLSIMKKRMNATL